MYSERIKLLRKELKLSANGLSEQIGIPTRTIVSYESGRTPSLEFVAQLCNVFHVNCNWFIMGSGEMFIEEPKDFDLSERLDKLEKALADAGILIKS